ncbi:MAG TPA: DUF1573 domain-containing protein [Ohtaekwangia sp.]|nr:DUF1573 domain-containing protein [Ohtaekwangia sp.]
MKRMSIYAGLLVTLAAVFSQLCAVPGYSFRKPDASFKWESLVHDFGTIKRNVPVSHKFTFTNNGDAPLVISSVQASCGCTVADYSKDPIPPGAEGYVSATYNAATVGTFNKTVTVNANIPEGAVKLSIKGQVTE